MSVESCIPIIPTADFEKTLRLWMDGLGFAKNREMYQDGKLVGCMLHKGNLHFWLNQRAGTPIKPENYSGIALYWAPPNLDTLRQHLKQLGYKVSEIQIRDYGQTEFFLTDDDGYTHCFGVATAK
jgi:hypothetical protein